MDVVGGQGGFTLKKDNLNGVQKPIWNLLQVTGSDDECVNITAWHN